MVKIWKKNSVKQEIIFKKFIKYKKYYNTN